MFILLSEVHDMRKNMCNDEGILEHPSQHL